MAIIHPNNLSLDYADPKEHGYAEFYITNLIKGLDSELTKDWHFFYSFVFKSTSLRSSLNKKRTYRDCEIDFLCLLPNIGVFVFEIKGGKISRTINEYEDPEYTSTDGKGIVHPIKNPYLQAKDNYYYLSENIGDIESDGRIFELTNYVGDHLVGFPDMISLPFKDQQQTHYNTFLKGNDLYKFFIDAGKAIGGGKRKTPTLSDVKAIIKALNRENFEYKYDLGDYIDTVNIRVDMLTIEQETVLRGLLDNKRCLIYGQAGTGKTVLSEMLFNHFLSEKKRVAYFSYNDFNAEKVDEDLKNRQDKSQDSISKPFLKYVAEQYQLISGNEELPLDDKKQPDYDLMRNYLIDHKDDKNFKKYSVLIIDEAQDIRKNYGSDDESSILLLLDAMLVGGLKDGSAYIFYDDAQNINFNNNPFYKDPCFGPEQYRYAMFRLTNNCRNTKPIADKINQFAVGMPIDSLAVPGYITVNHFNNVKDLAKSAILKIRELLNKGVEPKSITILHTANNKEDSPVPSIISAFESSGLNIKKYTLVNAKESITYTTNRKFKGLESDVVIYLRFERFKKDSTINVDYVTVSRAKGLCYIFNLTE